MNAETKIMFDTIVRRIKTLQKSLNTNDLRQFGMREGLAEALEVVKATMAPTPVTKSTGASDGESDGESDPSFIELMWGTDEVPLSLNQVCTLRDVLGRGVRSLIRHAHLDTKVLVQEYCIAIPIKSTEVNYKSIWLDLRKFVLDEFGEDLGEGCLLKRGVRSDKGVFLHFQGFLKSKDKEEDAKPPESEGFAVVRADDGSDFLAGGRVLLPEPKGF